MSSGLYGIINSNRSADDHWGKNCFNSSFPTSLACYMMDKNINALYITLTKDKGELRVTSTEIPIRDAFNCGNKTSKDLFFSFESVFSPYQ